MLNLHINNFNSTYIYIKISIKKKNLKKYNLQVVKNYIFIIHTHINKELCKLISVYIIYTYI